MTLLPLDVHAEISLRCAEQQGWLVTYNPVIQTVLTAIQIALVTFLTVFTFKRTEQVTRETQQRTERQKREERRAAFFHALILNGGLGKLRESFETIGSKLQKAANELEAHRAHWLAARTVGFISETMIDYSVNLSAALRMFALRVNVMDRELAQQIERHCDVLEERVTDWFDRAARRQAYDSCESLNEILIQGENEVYRLIHNYEFKD